MILLFYWMIKPQLLVNTTESEIHRKDKNTQKFKKSYI